MALVRGPQVLAVILAVWMSCCSGLRFASTPVGLQCPTASVQMLTVPVKNCCGKIVGYESRAPKPGEKGFMQCQCNEKRSSAGEAVRTRGSVVVEMLPSRELAFELPAYIPEPKTQSGYLLSLYSIPSPPAVRPPDANLAA